MAEMVDVVIVGAGPYGISLGLHLKALGVSFKVFGPPMRTWLDTMPKGMDLKSEGYASTIHDPSGKSLATYCAERGLPYKAVSLPVPLDVFGTYGLDCYNRLGDHADTRMVTGVSKDTTGHRVVLADGEEIRCKRVIIAVGITHFDYLPDQFSKVSSDKISHSSGHHHLEKFNRKRLMVIGAGASAIDLAVLAAEAGADVSMVCRGEIAWNIKRQDPRPLYERIRLPESCMGPGLRSCLYEKSPLTFKSLPSGTRDRIAREFAGPAGGWAVHERFDEAVNYVPFTVVDSIADRGDYLSVTLESEEGTKTEHQVDQMVCATGYKTDLGRLAFLDDKIRNSIAVINGSPVLSSNYESTVEGMYFVGKASAVTFGPLMRFVCGTGYAAKRLSRHLSKAN